MSNPNRSKTHVWDTFSDTAVYCGIVIKDAETVVWRTTPEIIREVSNPCPDCLKAMKTTPYGTFQNFISAFAGRSIDELGSGKIWKIFHDEIRDYFGTLPLKIKELRLACKICKDLFPIDVEFHEVKEHAVDHSESYLKTLFQVEEIVFYED